ncbi:MAG: hypothetical protein H6722_01815 [Sandaracinus sp.]|nr:hypothetical protein [Sandaracinus sp.]MCB9620775.1 hypothetical protein [Sandaracinus sp.]MCB9623742.1 hypothetical protein [Sandaracinus sp.]
MRHVVLALGFLLTSSAVAQTPLVYVRCARTDAPVDLTLDVTVDGVTRSTTRTMRGVDVYDVLPDVTHFFSGFSAPCDLMHRAADGTERILYDCSGTSTDESSCAAMDPAVSFDGATVAFTVFRGALAAGSEPVHPQVIDARAEPGSPVRLPLPNRYLDATEAQLHLVDVATGEVRALPHEPETFDAGPAFLPNGRLAFTSSRDGHTTTLVFGTNSSGRGSRVWAMDLDGRNVDLSSHHSLAQEQHPIVLRDGRVALTSWQIFGGLPFRHTNGSPGGFTTIANLFHLYTQAPDGAHPFAFYGQHAGDHTPLTSTGVDHKAAHFLTQTSDGRVWFTDYYRGNNNGLGVVVGVMPEPEGQEGFGPEEITARGDLYAPRDVARLTRWATSGDNMARPMPEPAYSVPTYADPLPFAGKVGHPTALPDGGLVVTWGKGACSTVSGNGVFEALGRAAPPLTSGSGSGTAMNVITSLEMDTPGCDAGLYRVTTFPSMHPRDLELVVDTRQWHEIQARALVPYAAIHGVAQPATIEPADVRTSHSALEVGTPFGLLGAASILDRETHPHGGILFQGEHQFHNQGTDTIDYGDDDLCGVRILGVMPNRGRNTYQELSNVAGERVRILGEIPVRHRNADGTPRFDPSGNPDTSFLVRMPANVPYLMQGIDCDGRTLNTDQTWQSLRPGEQKTCGGCHVHSRESRIGFEESFAATDDYAIPELGMGTVPLLAGRGEDGVVQTREADGDGLAIDFETDVLPIFERRCNECHGGASPAAGLALDRPGVDRDTQSTWYCLVGDKHQTCVPESLRHTTGAGSTGTTLRRPQLTRYVRAFNALSSLLYWKAAGERTDGRTDATFGDDESPERRDVDFGAAHPTEITPEELGVLARWIDIGSAGGPMERRDTQFPTLHLGATVDGFEVVALHVGTVDLGEGVDEASLSVCVLEGDTCGLDLSTPANAHGVVRIALDAPLSNPDVEVEARVRDLAGNETVVRRTVAWLLRAPPPPPPRPDGGLVVDGGVRGDAGESEGTTSGGCGCRTAGPRDTGFVALAFVAFVARRRRVTR